MSAFPIVAVVSDVADPEAVCELLSALPPRADAALIVVPRLDAGSERSLFAALSQRTTRPVVRALDGMTVESGQVYLIPANGTLTLSAGRLSVSAATARQADTGNALCAALAHECGARAIGVVLSGRGADGALGIAAIRAAGGATFAQYPGSARYPGMPLCAIETGCVDLVLRPNEIARELARLSRPAPAAIGAPLWDPGARRSLSRVAGARE